MPEVADVQKNHEKNHEENHVVSKCSDLPFFCSACKSLLAFVDSETRSKIRIKHRDLYIYIIDPQLFEITCRSCGELNQLSYVDQTH
jgi:hypothetical protein